ncbi:DUF2303 family protein [Escherichia coli]|nr:DUF2303 family protein [Escherichia coli]NHV00606.1 DUF2303 family protein [Escherichia coli]
MSQNLDATAINQIHALISAQGVNEIISKIGADAVALPENFRIHDLEKFNLNRFRFRGALSTASIDDFTRYSKDLADEGTRCFIDADNMRAVSVLKRADGTSTPAVRKMRIDSKTSWLSACRRAGIEDFRFHDLRHTWASWLIQSGVPLSVLQEMGGWESIEMVRRYAHLAPNHLTEHARKIDDIFGDNVPNMSHCGIMEDIKKA